jgi:uncharacterized membrane protein
LQGLDVHFDGWPGEALAINDAGTAVGYAEDWDPSYVSVKPYATRWNAPGTAINALGYPGNSGGISTTATAINKSGVVIGWGGAGYRWDASGALIHSLDGMPEAINDAGTAVGAFQTNRAARWDPASATGTALDGLGLDSYSRAWDINNTGTAVGTAAPSSAGNTTRAVRWDAEGVAVTELGTLSTLTYSYYVAAHINDAGAIVGSASNDSTSDSRAIFWGPDGVAVDLNTLIDPQSGWTLTAAQGLSNTGWVVGTGTFDPDGVGRQAAYGRLFLMQVPVTTFPEPGGLALLWGGCSVLVHRRRRKGHALTPSKDKSTSNDD